MSAPFRDPAIEPRLAEIEKKLDEHLRAIENLKMAYRRGVGSSLGQWIFRTTGMILGVSLLSAAAFGTYKGCQSANRERAKMATTASGRQRRSDDRMCDSLDGRYVNRVNKTLVCRTNGPNEKLITVREVYEDGIATMKVETQDF